MQAYIININKVKDEDLIVTLLSEDNIYLAYRFYGARHSHINIGYKIDFELEVNMKSTIPRLKDVLQISSFWIFDNDKMYHWQRYIKLFYTHLKDVDTLDGFYINLLDTLALKMNKQNHKRAIIESYVTLCDYEGRLNKQLECLLCDLKIIDDISLVRSFIPTHASCSYSKSFSIENIKELFNDKTLVSFTDEEVDYLWYVLMQGL